MNTRPKQVNPKFWDMLRASQNPATAETIRLLIIRFEDTNNLMNLARNELHAGREESALECARHSGQRYADFQVVSEQLERGGLDVDKLLADAGLAPASLPAPSDLQTVTLDPRERATVLHTLECLKENRVTPGPCMFGECDHFAAVSVLTSEEIERLSLRIDDSPLYPSL